MGISMNFEISGHFQCQGDGRTLHGYNIYDDALLHKEQEYKWLYKGWGCRQVLRYIKKFPKHWGWG